MGELSVQEGVTLSLVIPTYNRADLIGETIASALGQTRSFTEIIVVDDGSTDNTQEVLQKFEGRIRLLRTPNQGVQAARNAGVAIATSEYISFCDSDDLLEPEFVRKVAAYFLEDPQCDILYCNFIPFTDRTTFPDKFSMAPPGFFSGATVHGEFLSEIPDLYKRLIDFQPMFTAGNSMKKNFFHAIGGYRVEFKGIGSEDLEFLLRAVGAGKLSVSQCPLARVRKHVGNESANAARQAQGEARILEYSLAQHPHAMAYKDAVLSSVEERRLSAFHGAFAEGNFELAAEMLSLLRKKPSDLKFLLKRLILALPSVCRSNLWRIAQARA
ncbi:glycosyltransferase family A protein [Janthinobacterium sp. 17J80-10]|uniref:glycosyltransferase family 2 protein n=1 Tax=Janthinobacterium sp. 17J80-10 TaxID=2497863 RepID=UPI001005353C|nr:glycosyltransferase family A protein [Janthinobacterium sp. 17J80-10]QAU35406.1 glycosyltransferase [Janthinobacterium sp. 17J80-10]